MLWVVVSSLLHQFRPLYTAAIPDRPGRRSMTGSVWTRTEGFIFWCKADNFRLVTDHGIFKNVNMLVERSHPRDRHSHAKSDLVRVVQTVWGTPGITTEHALCHEAFGPSGPTYHPRTFATNK